MHPPLLVERAKSEECVVADAVFVEPVSTVTVPANREMNREFRLFEPLYGVETQSSLVNSIVFRPIPYTKKQGIISKEQGIQTKAQGICHAEVRNADRSFPSCVQY